MKSVLGEIKERPVKSHPIPPSHQPAAMADPMVNLLSEIKQENEQRLRGMTPEEIMAEQQTIREQLNGKVLAMFEQRLNNKAGL